MSDGIEIRRVLVKVAKSVPKDGAYFMCRITPGRDWWDLDALLEKIPGHRPMSDAISPYAWHAVPVTQMAALEAIAESNPGRLRVHHTK